MMSVTNIVFEQRISVAFRSDARTKRELVLCTKRSANWNGFGSERGVGPGVS
jgi:hypothetical protein